MSNAVKMDKYEQLAYARSFIHRGAVVNYPENEFGLYGDMNDDIQPKCSRCKAYVGNAEPLEAGEQNG